MTPEVYQHELARKTGVVGVFAIFFAAIILLTSAIPAFLEGAIEIGVTWLAVVAVLIGGGSWAIARWYRVMSAYEFGARSVRRGPRDRER